MQHPAKNQGTMTAIKLHWLSSANLNKTKNEVQAITKMEVGKM